MVYTTFVTSMTLDKAGTPGRTWGSLHRVVEAAIKAGKVPLEDVERVIDDVVAWAGVVQAQRKEQGWFKGEEWAALMDVWISLGKQVSGTLRGRVQDLMISLGTILLSTRH